MRPPPPFSFFSFIILIVILILIALPLSPAFSAPTVRLLGDRLTIRAERASLRDVLDQFVYAGVDVRVDPELDFTVTGSCANTPVEEALEALLEPCSYVVFWEMVEGPIGAYPRLSELQVFANGHRDRVRPLPANDGRFRVQRDPQGRLYVADEILLRFRPGVSQAEIDAILARIGGTIVESVPALGLYRVRLPPGTDIPALAATLAGETAIARAEPNYAHPLPVGAYDPSSTAGAATTPDAPVAGAARVAILDSGLLAAAGLGSLVVGQLDAVQPSRSLTDPAGHGTQMALIAAGAVAPDGTTASETGVPLIAIRSFDEQGLTSNFALSRAIEYAISQGARVINLSWGSESDSAFVAESVAYAQQQGAIVVAAAGNEATGTAMYPAAYDGVVAVAALRADGTPWENSNYGSFVDVAAPGEATLPVGYQGPAGTYAGTSIASAYVARELSLYLTQHPTATAADAVQALTTAVTGSTITSTNRYGAGALDAAASARLLGTD